MSQFIHHMLMMLEDVGMSIRYPEIRHVTLEENGKSTIHMSFVSRLGTRVSIEQNPQMKFMMIFALLDFHIDATHPGMEGKSYKKKYENLPAIGDFDLILRQLFRVAKVVRNALVHNPSAFSVSGGNVAVGYTFGGTSFSLQMSAEALTNFYTMIVMYLKGDMGKGGYFLGIIRSIYRSFLAGLGSFSDEFGSSLEQPSAGTIIKPHVRQVFLNPEHKAENARIHIVIPERKIQEWEGMDFQISHNGDDFLIPSEALDSDFSISEHDLVSNWKREGRFPPMK